MKKFTLLFWAVALFMGTAVACSSSDDDHPVSIDQLPAAITSFIQSHFAGVEISHARLDTEFGGNEYEVILANGMKIDFTTEGEWTEIDCERSEVPASIVPQQIGDYVKQNYPSSLIEKLSRNANFYEAELNNDLEILFDKEFNFVRVDN